MFSGTLNAIIKRNLKKTVHNSISGSGKTGFWEETMEDDKKLEPLQTGEQDCPDLGDLSLSTPVEEKHEKTGESGQMGFPGSAADLKDIPVQKPVDWETDRPAQARE